MLSRKGKFGILIQFALSRKIIALTISPAFQFSDQRDEMCDGDGVTNMKPEKQTNSLHSNNVDMVDACVNGSKNSTKGGAKFSKIGVVSSHSNPKILKSKHKSRYGPLSPYDTEEHDEEDEEDVDEENEDDDWFSDDDCPEDKADKHLSKLQNASKTRQGEHKNLERGLGVRSLSSGRSLDIGCEII